MTNDLTVIEDIIAPLKPRMTDVLAGSGLPVERLIQTFYFSVEQNERLMEPQFRASLPRACMSAACLGVEVDGVTGQGFIIPYGGQRPTAQFQLGYKGYPTIGARAGVSFNMNVVREEDEFDFGEGSKAFVHHKRQLGKERERKIIAAYAVASHNDRPDVVSVLSIDQILDIKSKSPGAKKQDSPWNDKLVGFPAMCSKTALRQVGKLVPVRGIQIASRMDEAFEAQGLTSYVAPTDDGSTQLIIDGKVETEIESAAVEQAATTPTFQVSLADGTARTFETIGEWRAFMSKGIQSCAGDPKRLQEFRDRNQDEIERLRQGFPGEVHVLDEQIALVSKQ